MNLELSTTQLTYCKVDSNARKLPSFPTAHRLISKSSVSAILWNYQIKQFERTQRR